MTRTLHSPDDDRPRPAIDDSAVVEFFEQRGGRIPEVGPTRAVIYQDKHPDLAERRDAMERARLLPLLRLDGGQDLLDLGCGTGRWVESLMPHLASYHGVDMTETFVQWARREHAAQTRASFTRGRAEEVAVTLPVGTTFDRVLCAGVLIYLNDDAVLRTLDGVAGLLRPRSLVLIREPVAQENRLTLLEHHSEELEASYSAIYRTRHELLELITTTLGRAGWGVEASGYVFDDPDLNNRTETRQEWFVVGREN